MAPPQRRRRSVPRDQALDIFATAPTLDTDDLREDLDATIDQALREAVPATTSTRPSPPRKSFGPGEETSD